MDEQTLLYNALMAGRNRKTQREEYLCATGQKSPACFDVCDRELFFEDIFKDTRGCVRLRLEEEGYLEIFVQCTDPFVRPDQNAANLEGEKGTETEIYFTVSASKLHNGRNFARLVFKTARQVLSADITVYNRIIPDIGAENPRKLPCELTRGYLYFRMGRISQQQWQNSVFEKLSGVTGNTPGDLFCMLYRAHVYVISGESGDCVNIIEYVSAQLESRTDYSAELFAYYLYVKSLYEKDDSFTRSASESIKALYDENPSWQLLWICFFTDEAFAGDPQKKLAEIKKLFDAGKCTSPVMYFEAWEIIRNNPGLICEAGIRFSLQLLEFALRRDISDAAPVLAFSEILFKASPEELSQVSLSLCTGILKKAFDKYPAGILNSTTARLLILSGNKDRENHRYFERAVFDFADIPGLYDFYFDTADDENTQRIPERLLRIIAANPSYRYENFAWVCANIITNRYESSAYKNAYEKCRDVIAGYAYECAANGLNSARLSLIYGHVLQNSGSDTELKRVIFKAAFIRQVSCRKSDMARVLIFHKELSSYMSVPLENSKALVSVFSPDALILFQDRTGGIYRLSEYDEEVFCDTAEYAKYCIKDIPVTARMLMGSCLEITRREKSPEEVLDFLSAQYDSADFAKEYLLSLTEDIFRYYTRQPVSDEVYERLCSFRSKEISGAARGIIIGLMIENRDYDGAVREIKKNGFSDVEDKALAALTHILVQLAGEDETEFVLNLSAACLKNGTADSEILRYMCLRLEKPLSLLVPLYEKSGEKGIYNLSAAENILICAALEEKEPDILPDVFKRCYEQSSRRELIKSFLEYCADRYLYGFELKSTVYFEYIGKELLRGTEFSDRAKAAYLIFMSDKDILPKSVKTLRTVLEKLVYKGIMFDEFKRYKNKFPVPAVLENTYIVRADSEQGCPVIKYKISSERINKEAECEMDMLFPGIYVKYFTLLFGESLTWSTDENKSTSVSFSDIQACTDISRFSMADEISRLEFSENKEAFNAALKRYYITDELISSLF